MMRRTKPCADRTSKVDCERSKFPRCSWDAILKCFNAKNPPKLKAAKNPPAVQSAPEKPPAKLGVDTALPSGSGGGSSPLDDCFDPSCHSKQEMFRMMMGKAKRKGTPVLVSSEGTSTQNKAANSLIGKGHSTNDGPLECPADREELGRQSWTLLHSIAAYYPKTPSAEHRRHAHAFLEALSHLYPCTHCAYHLRESMVQAPPTLESRDEFSMWLCAQHNEVNRRLGKPEFECDVEGLQRRWRTGDPRCWMMPSGGETDEGDQDMRTTASESLGQSSE